MCGKLSAFNFVRNYFRIIFAPEFNEQLNRKQSGGGIGYEHQPTHFQMQI